MAELPLPEPIAPTVLSEALIHSVESPCGTECFLLGNPPAIVSTFPFVLLPAGPCFRELSGANKTQKFATLYCPFLQIFRPVSWQLSAANRATRQGFILSGFDIQHNLPIFSRYSDIDDASSRTRKSCTHLTRPTKDVKSKAQTRIWVRSTRIHIPYMSDYISNKISTHNISLRKNNHPLFRLLAYILPFAFCRKLPCSHTGPCDARSNCSCFTNYAHCESGCRCDRKCRFPLLKTFQSWTHEYRSSPMAGMCLCKVKTSQDMQDRPMSLLPCSQRMQSRNMY